MAKIEYKKVAPAEKSYQLYNYGARPASYDAYVDGVLFAHIKGVKQSYGPRAGYVVTRAGAVGYARAGTLKGAKREVERLVAALKPEARQG